MIVVVKVGTSSLTDSSGNIEESAMASLAADVAAVRAGGNDVVVVSSGAIAAGLPVLGMGAARPTDIVTLQAVASVGQPRLIRFWVDHLARHDLIAGQFLLAPGDFVNRSQYLHARSTITRDLQLGVVPVVNENDAVADDEIRFGDNDRLAALVAHLVGADLLVLLTDTPGVLTADPRIDRDASLIEEIVEVDHELEQVAGGAGSERGSGGMASKLAAAKMAAWSGVRVVIGAGHRPGVLPGAVDGQSGIGTIVHARAPRLSARKVWIAFAIAPSGTVVVDAGARQALVDRATSLLPAGVVDVQGTFAADQAVEIADETGAVFAKGLTRHASMRIKEWAGRRTAELPAGVPHEVVHRDDLVVLPS